VTRDSGAKWHDKGLPKYFVKITGKTRIAIETAIKQLGVDRGSLLAKLLPNARWPEVSWSTSGMPYSSDGEQDWFEVMLDAARSKAHRPGLAEQVNNANMSDAFPQIF